MSRCWVISVINWKGGVGKTTLTHHLGTGLLHLDESQWFRYLGKKEPPRVLLLDCDAQCNLSISCLSADLYEELAYAKKLGTLKELFKPFLENDDANIDVNQYILKWHVRRQRDKVYPTVDLLPSHQDLVYTDMDIAVYQRASYVGSFRTELYKLNVLARIIDRIRQNYDYIFIDCPPNLNYITQNAIYASDFYIIPTMLDKLSTYGLSALINKVDKLNQLFTQASPGYWPTQLLGIVANSVREYGREPKGSQSYIMERIQYMFGDMVFQNYLTYGEGVAKGSELGNPVYTDINCRQSKMMLAVLYEVMERLLEVSR
ncbi:MAG: ParA family protein [Syntrophomonadaceae bacterium]|jgi:chromosome partitioning protein